MQRGEEQRRGTESRAVQRAGRRRGKRGERRAHQRSSLTGSGLDLRAARTPTSPRWAVEEKARWRDGKREGRGERERENRRRTPRSNKSARRAVIKTIWETEGCNRLLLLRVWVGGGGVIRISILMKKKKKASPSRLRERIRLHKVASRTEEAEALSSDTIDPAWRWNSRL